MLYVQIGDDWFFGDVEKQLHNRKIPLSSLTLKSDYSLTHPSHQQITSEIELIFHGLGGGGERSSSLTKLFARQLVMMKATKSLYFCLDHEKRASVTTSSKAVANHKLPNTLVPHYLLYRWICIALKASDTEAIAYIPRRSYYMKDSVASHFCIDSTTFSDLDIRHLWTSASNLLFNENGYNGSLVAVGDAAEMSNHSAQIHKKYYSTYEANRQETMYGMYHRFFGENTVSNTEVEWAEVSKESQLKALRLLCGPSATFHSKNQQEMVNICCNDRDRHNFFGIECGGGKSMAVLVPVTAEFLLKRQTGIRVFVVPYGFLKDSLHKAFEHRLACVGPNIKVLSLSAADISNDSSDRLPPILVDDISSVNILILTLDAAANLAKYHSWFLQSLSRQGRLSSFYFDEIQTMVTEFGFRGVYQAIRDFAQYKCPVSILSGSFHPDLVAPTMTYLGLDSHVSREDGEQRDSDSEIDMNILHTKDVLGSGFSFIVAKCRGLEEVGHYVSSRTKHLESHHIHLICKDTGSAINTHAQLETLGVKSRLAHAQIARSEQGQIAEEWYHGNTTVLVSTSIALVGNENPHCREIVVVGMIYNLAALIQAIGRLRKNQRGDDARVIQVLLPSEDASLNRFSEESDINIQQLKNAGVMRAASLRLMSELFHYRNYHKLMSEGGCTIKRLSLACGNVRPECGRCTWCQSKSVTVNLADIIDGKKQGEDKQSITQVGSNCGNTQAHLLQKPSSASVPFPTPHEKDNLQGKQIVGDATPKKKSDGCHGRESKVRGNKLSAIQSAPPGTVRGTITRKNNKVFSLTGNPYANASKRPVQHQQPGQKIRKTAIEETASSSQHEIAQRTKLVQNAKKIENMLKFKCQLCNCKKCIGDCVKGCFTCGSGCSYKTCKYHWKSENGQNLNKFLKAQRVCSICFTPITENGDHGIVEGTQNEIKCVMKKRFRALVRKQCKEGKHTGKYEYAEHVRGIHASRDTYYRYISSLFPQQT